MKTLKVTLNATCVSYVQYKCLVDANDDADPEDLICALTDSIDGSEFVEMNEMNGDWHSDGSEWEVVEGGNSQQLPRWRYLSGGSERIEQVS